MYIEKGAKGCKPLHSSCGFERNRECCANHPHIPTDAVQFGSGGSMPRRFSRSGLLAWAALLLAIPAGAQQPEAQAADITFSLGDASRSATWPVAVREVAIDGKPIRLDRPVHVEGSWLRTVTITLRNISPKTIVSGGIGLVFPESGDGSS